MDSLATLLEALYTSAALVGLAWYEPKGLSEVLLTLSLGLVIAERVDFVTSSSYSDALAHPDMAKKYKLSTACFSMSVITNVVATAFIACRAWSMSFLFSYE
jgi:hypothetical protein